MNALKVSKAVLISAVCLAGCSTQAPSSRSPQNRVVIQSGERLFTSPEPAELKATMGATPMLELTVQGASDGELWSINARFAEAQLRQPRTLPGELSAKLSNGASAEGLAQLSLGSRQGAARTASSGTLNVTIADGRITGEAEADPSELGASIEGDVVISCWIPRTDSKSGGTTDAANSEVLVEDTDLSSAACAPLKALLPQH